MMNGDASGKRKGPAEGRKPEHILLNKPNWINILGSASDTWFGSTEHRRPVPTVHSTTMSR